VRGDLEAPEQTWARWQQAIDHPAESPMVELRFSGPPRRHVLLCLFPIHGGSEGALGVLVRDVTAERELVRARAELVSMVSHDLRTPLTSLVGFAELLLTHDYPEPTRREYLATMLREGQRLTALTDDFLDLQRLESGALALTLQPTDLSAPLVHAATAAGEDPSHPLVVQAANGLPPVLADANRLLQMLTNLLSNARKYSPTGGDSPLCPPQGRRGGSERPGPGAGHPSGDGAASL
jgi:signal transduction histidine kinase